MNGITFNGVHNSKIDGLNYISSSRFIMPENRDTYKDIPYCDSSILIPDKSKKDIEIPVDFTLKADNVEDLFTRFLQIIEWLDTIDRAPLIFDDVPSYYYNAKAYTNVTFEQIADFEEIADFTIVFRCEPYPKVVGS